MSSFIDAHTHSPLEPKANDMSSAALSASVSDCTSYCEKKSRGSILCSRSRSQCSDKPYSCCALRQSSRSRTHAACCAPLARTRPGVVSSERSAESRSIQKSCTPSSAPA
eukprot:6135263-Prymnesium_polylepis.1